jgi:hypothetical protein
MMMLMMDDDDGGDMRCVANDHRISRGYPGSSSRSSAQTGGTNIAAGAVAGQDRTGGPTHRTVVVAAETH